MTNGVQSPSFTVHKGTRQGCPPSPLLFALALEPLAEVIRSQDVHKIALYADDILRFLTKPDISIPATLSTMHEFGSYSGYNINFDKSEAMPLGNSAVQNLPPNCPLKCSPNGFTYLGIIVSPNLTELWKLNFSPTPTLLSTFLKRDLKVTRSSSIIHGMYKSN